jgi:hypothetical protein
VFAGGRVRDAFDDDEPTTSGNVLGKASENDDGSALWIAVGMGLILLGALIFVIMS